MYVYLLMKYAYRILIQNNVTRVPDTGLHCFKYFITAHIRVIRVVTGVSIATDSRSSMGGNEISNAITYKCYVACLILATNTKLNNNNNNPAHSSFSHVLWERATFVTIVFLLLLHRTSFIEIFIHIHKLLLSHIVAQCSPK